MITACFNVAGTVPDSSDMLMIVANVGAGMSMLAFTSDVGNGSSTLVFVGHFVSSVVMPANATSEQDDSQCI